MDVLGSDVINLHLVAGQIAWSIAGTDEGGCTSSGSGAFTITGAYNPTNLNLFFNLLPGSPHFLAYEGNAYPDGGTEATYTRSCPGRPTDTIPTPVAPFFMADGTGKVYPDGTLVGNVTVSDGSGTTTWEWDLRPDIR